MLKRYSILCGLIVLASLSFRMHSANAADAAPSAQKANPPQTQKKETTATAENDRRKPLPTYYGMLGISDKQREELAKVQDEYEVKLDQLREELKRTVAERNRKMEVMLSAGQKLRLKELREAARLKAQQKPVTPKSE